MRKSSLAILFVLCSVMVHAEAVLASKNPTGVNRAVSNIGSGTGATQSCLVPKSPRPSGPPPYLNVNGCTIVPDSEIALISSYHFQQACNRHDICYSGGMDVRSCNRSRINCDNQFYWDMERECNAYYESAGRPWWNPIIVAKYNKCRAQARIYYDGVRMFGADLFDDIRHHYCETSSSNNQCVIPVQTQGSQTSP